MKYIVLQPGNEPEIIEADKIDLDTLQKHVGGLITITSGPGLDIIGIDIVANDEGLLIGAEPNVGWVIEREPMVLVGGLVFVAHDDEGETIGLTDDEIRSALLWIKRTRAALPLVLFSLRLQR